MKQIIIRLVIIGTIVLFYVKCNDKKTFVKEDEISTVRKSLISKYNADTSWEKFNYTIDFQENIIKKHKLIFAHGFINDIIIADSGNIIVDLEMGGIVQRTQIEINKEQLQILKMKEVLTFDFIISINRVRSAKMSLINTGTSDEESSIENERGVCVYGDLVEVVPISMKKKPD